MNRMQEAVKVHDKYNNLREILLKETLEKIKTSQSMKEVKKAEEEHKVKLEILGRKMEEEYDSI